jgi:hypothetical protein
LIGGPFDEPVPGGSAPPEAASTAESGTPMPEGVEAGQTETAIPLANLPEDCLNALDVQREDVGTTTCVGGIVYRAWQEHGTFYIDFSEKSSSFFFIGFDWESPFVIRVGDCVYAKGKIVETDRVPSMGIDPYTIKRCPDAQTDSGT